MKLLNRFEIDIKTLKFVIVGIINTLFGTGLMFILYNCFNAGYYFSSFCNYFFGSILSYFLNKYFTFKCKKKSFKTILSFIINILLCYLLAYGIAQQAVKFILSGFDKKIIDNISMLVGMCLFVGLNYIGQRYIVFKDENNKEN